MSCCGNNVKESVVVVEPQQEASSRVDVAHSKVESRLNEDQKNAKVKPPKETYRQGGAGERATETDADRSSIRGGHAISGGVASSSGSSSNNNNSIIMSSKAARDSSQSLMGSSLKEAWTLLVADHPETVEANEIQRAIELSLLDCALVVHSHSSAEHQRQQHQSVVTVDDPHQVLGLSPNGDATLEQIKTAYRKRVLETHPDKPGGCRHEFARVVAAYRSLLATANHHHHHRQNRNTSDGASVLTTTRMDDSLEQNHKYTTTAKSLKSTAHWDASLKGHWDLVRELFANHDASVDEIAARQQAVRSVLELRPKEAGASNRNERHERIRNSCFYLSLAVSYLNGIGALMCPPFETATTTKGRSMDGALSRDDEQDMLRATDDALISHTALQLKRTIEAAVIKAHPEWARAGLVGEEVQAFSDFLVYTLESDTILRDWAVAIFDETSGFVDVYKGRDYGGGDNNNNNNSTEEDDWARRSNTLTLRYVPGHYQPLLPLMTRPSLDEILITLDKEGVFYVVTDGSA